MAGWFVTTPGFLDCPKCGGWQIRDVTKRRANGWPIGPIIIENCDHCAGKGELPDPNYKAKVNPWAAIKPAPTVAPVPVHGLPIWDIDDPAPPIVEAGPWAALKPEPEVKGWGSYGKNT